MPQLIAIKVEDIGLGGDPLNVWIQVVVTRGATRDLR